MLLLVKRLGPFTCTSSSAHLSSRIQSYSDHFLVERWVFPGFDYIGKGIWKHRRDFEYHRDSLWRSVSDLCLSIRGVIANSHHRSYLSKAKNHGRFYQESNVEESLTTALLESTSENERATEVGLERLGLWGILWQLLNLVFCTVCSSLVLKADFSIAAGSLCFVGNVH